MNRALRIGGLLAVGLAIGVGLGAALWNGDEAKPDRGAGVLLVQPADAGRLERVGGDRYRLVLSPPEPRTYAFTDRPERRTTSFATSTTPQRWLLGDFIVDPPNAALQIEPDDRARPRIRRPQTLVFELTGPHFDPARGELSYGAILLGSDRRPPRSFGESALFIDNADPGVASAGAPSGQAELSPQGAETIEQLQTTVNSALRQQGGELPSLATQAAQKIQEYARQIEQQMAQGGEVSLATMFQLQFQMQIMSQYIEAVSNMLSALNSEMMTMARSIKGQ
jgi:hypothetical protein